MSVKASRAAPPPTTPLTFHAPFPCLEGDGISLCARLSHGDPGCDNGLLFSLKRLQRPRAFCIRGGQSLDEIRIRRQTPHRAYESFRRSSNLICSLIGELRPKIVIGGQLTACYLFCCAWGGLRGRQGMQRGTKKVRITLWRQILEYGDVEVTVPLNASLDQIIEAAVAEYENTENEAGLYTDGETIGWRKATSRLVGVPMVRPGNFDLRGDIQLTNFVTVSVKIGPGHGQGPQW